MPFITTEDATQIFYKDWGTPTGPVVTFSHGWPLNSDNFEAQMFFLASLGYRCIAHDRRGHDRSSQTWGGNDMDTYAADLLALFENLDLQEVTMVGHSTGGGEVVRFAAGSGGWRVKKAVLIGAVTPVMVKKKSNPLGTDINVFNNFRDLMTHDRAQFFLDVPTGPFFGFNREDAKVSEGLIRSWWQQGMIFTKDMKKLSVPVLILHGEDDQIVPIADSAELGIELLKKGTLKTFPGGPHALPNIMADEVNREILAFLKEDESAGKPVAPPKKARKSPRRKSPRAAPARPAKKR